MQDEASQSDVNPGMVEQRLDEAPVEREGLQRGDVEREGLRGGPATEPADGGQTTQREGVE